MPDNQLPYYELRVQTGDAAAEIFIIDAAFHRIDKGCGEQVIFKLPGGLYTVKVQTGEESSEKVVALLTGDEQVTFEPIAFVSAAPLERTSKTHEYHMENAAAHSHTVHASIGTGGQLYLFVRDWTPEGGGSASGHQSKNPATGLHLRDKEGNILIDVARAAFVMETGDPWAACNISLNPGTYRLCLETLAGGAFEQTMVVSPGWQTQAFYLLKNYDTRACDMRADLASASVFMTATGGGFSQHYTPGYPGGQPDYRLAELARRALINDRFRLADNVMRQALNEKFSNPVLGIYAAHLLLRNDNYPRATVQAVISNLRNMLYQPHPDVEALAVKMGMGTNYTFDLPPMLRQSWVFLLEASVTQKEILGNASFVVQENTESICSEGLWMIWGSPAGKKNTDAELLRNLKNIMWLNAGGEERSDVWPGISRGVPDVTRQSPAFMTALSDFSGHSDSMNRTSVNDEQMLNLVNSMKVPRSKIESLIKMGIDNSGRSDVFF